MTKKSTARVARDEFKKSNTAWDDLTEIYKANQSELNEIVTTTQRFFDHADIGHIIPEGQREYAVKLIAGLASDVRNFQERLSAIYKQHSGRSGMHNHTEEGAYLRLIECGDLYVRYRQDCQTILKPLYNQVIGLMHTIEEFGNRKALAEQAALPVEGAVTTATV